MRRLYIIVGVLLGALIAWSFGHEGRKLVEQERQRKEAFRRSLKRNQIEWAIKSALDGNDYLSEEWWEQELAQYKDMPEEDDYW